MNIFVKPTIKSEAERLSEIQRAAFLPLYEKYRDNRNPALRGVEDITDKLDSGCHRYFTIFLDEKIVGGIVYRTKCDSIITDNMEEGLYYLNRIYIDPKLQCKGLGQKAILLAEKELADAKCFFVDFPEDMEKNRRCYEKAGFSDTGERIVTQDGPVLALYKKEVLRG